jgi:hypothetical protein
MDPLDPARTADEAALTEAPRRVRKPLMANTMLWTGLGLAGVGLAALWLNRTWLGEQAVIAALTGRGAPAAISVRDLRLDGARVAEFRVGGELNPAVQVREARVNWRFDPRAFQIVVDRVEVVGARVRLRVGEDGAVDFGELAPLLRAGTGRAFVRVGGVAARDATLFIDTPRGAALGRVDVTGDVQSGLNGAGFLFLPASVTGGPAAPLRLGFATRPGEGGRPETGLAVRFDGQDLDLLGSGGAFSVRGLRGGLDGQLRTGLGTLEAWLVPSLLRAEAFSAVGVTVRGATLSIAKAAWAHGVPPLRTGALHLAAGLSFQDVAVVDAQGRDQARLGRGGGGLAGRRSRDGALRVGVDLDARGLVAPAAAVAAGRIVATGGVEGRLNDWSRADLAEASGPIAIVADGVDLGARLGDALAGAPVSIRDRAALNALARQGRARASLRLSHGPRETRLALAAPLTLDGAGAGLRWTPARAPTNFAALSRPTGLPARLDVAASGRIDLALPDAALSADVEGLAVGPGGWGVRGAGAEARGLLIAGQGARATLDRFEAASPARSGGLPRLGASGALALTRGARGGADGLFAFDARTREDRLDFTLDGRASGALSDRALNVAASDARVSVRGALRETAGGFSGDWQGVMSARDARAAGWRAAGTEVRVADGMIGLRGGDFSLAGRLTGRAAGVTGRDLALRDVALSGPMGFARDAGGGLGADVNARARAGALQAGGVQGRDLTLDLTGRLRGPPGGAGVGGAMNVALAMGSGSAGEGENPVSWRALRLEGPLRFATTPLGLGVGAPRCLPLRLGGARAGELAIAASDGAICPDRQGRLVTFARQGPLFHAATRINPGAARLGEGEGARTLELGAIQGQMTTGPDGVWRYDLNAPDLRFGFALPDGGRATLTAARSRVSLRPGADGLSIDGALEELSAQGLPVTVAGDVDAALKSGEDGLSGAFDFTGLKVADVNAEAPRFGDLTLDGVGRIGDGEVRLTAVAQAALSKSELATFTLVHGLETGAGSLVAEAIDLGFVTGGPAALQPDALVPGLRGVVADATGTVSGDARFAWTPDAPLVSTGRFAVRGLSFSTLLGPVSGLTGEAVFDDLLGLRSRERQEIRVRLFDPGLPIENGVARFTFPGNNDLRLDSASWPFAGGTLAVRPATWSFGDADQKFQIDVNDVDLAQFLRLTEVPNLEIDGRVSGVFPIEVRNGQVEIVGGRLAAREGGGVIRYTGPGVAPPPPPKQGFFDRLLRRPPPPPQGADLAISALRALEYRVMEIRVDGRITGELQLGVVLEGANKDVLSGFPFRFNVTANIPVGQIRDGLSKVMDATTTIEQARELERLEAGDAAPPAPVAPPAPPVPPGS